MLPILEYQLVMSEVRKTYVLNTGWSLAFNVQQIRSGEIYRDVNGHEK
jgi:hypothetical protein